MKPKKNKRSSARVGPNKPPQLSSNVMFNHTYRFTSTSGTATGITATSLLCAAGSIGTVTNTTVSAIGATVKVNRVSIWTPPASQGSFATCSVEWFGGANTNNKEVSDTSNSVATPASIHSRPPAKSLASFWNAIGTNALFVLTAPVGSIIDVNLSVIFNDDDSLGTAMTTVATAVVGTIYYLSLDPNATHRYVPVSLTTTT